MTDDASAPRGDAGTVHAPAQVPVREPVDTGIPRPHRRGVPAPLEFGRPQPRSLGRSRPDPQSLSAAETRRPFHLRWWKRLDARLSFLFGVLLLACLLASPWLQQAIATHLEQKQEPDSYLLVGDQVARPLLVNAHLDADGLLVLDPAMVEAQVRRYASDGCGFLAIAQDQRVIAGSPVLLKEIGPTWNRSFDKIQRISPRSNPHLSWPTLVLPVTDPRLGHLFLAEVLLEPEVHARTHGLRAEDLLKRPDRCKFALRDPDRLTTEKHELERQLAGQMWLQRWVFVAVSVVGALLLGVLTSRFVTRRIQRLAAEAERMQLGTAHVPMPFTERGNDEITGLARAMNQMRERNLELLAAMESRDRQRREWIAQVSHDLRTPLTALRASLERAERQLQRQEHGGGELRASIEAAKLDGSRVVTLAEDLLEIARLDADPGLVREPVPPGELARSAVTSLRPMATEGNLEIELDIEAGLPIVEADGRRLMRALENLLANALQHARSRVRLQVLRSAGMLRFEVSDDGPGFPAENGRVDLASLASRLSREDSTGLGLQVALRVAEAHGGRLEADNLPSGGAFIALGLPQDREG